MTVPQLSICIPTFNRAELLGPLLEDLSFVHDLSFDVEIVVYDNASSDGTEALVRSFLDRLPVRYYRQRYNVGVAANAIAAFVYVSRPFRLAFCRPLGVP